MTWSFVVKYTYYPCFSFAVKRRDSIKNDLEFAWFKLNGNGCPEIADAEHVFDIYCEIQIIQENIYNFFQEKTNLAIKYVPHCNLTFPCDHYESKIHCPHQKCIENYKDLKPKIIMCIDFN